MAKGGCIFHLELMEPNVPFHKRLIRRGAFGARTMITIPITGLMFPQIQILHIFFIITI